MKEKRRWFKEFYQKDPTDNSTDFYCRQRHCEVILEEVGEYKHNVFIAEVKLINPLEPYETRGVCGGCKYQFRIGERFLLRKHKGDKNRPWYSTFYEKYWFDVRYPGREDFEMFEILPFHNHPSSEEQRVYAFIQHKKIINEEMEREKTLENKDE